MHNITIIYCPDDQIVAVPDGELLKEADAIIKDAQNEAVHVETSTWALIEWIRAQACEHGEPEKITIHHGDTIVTVNEYGAMRGWSDETPVNALHQATEKVLQHAFLKRKQEGYKRIDLAMQLHEQIENMLLANQSVFQICQALHTTIPRLTIDESKEVVMRVTKQMHHKVADYAD